MTKQNITGATRLAALLGSPVVHSLSPFIHNTAFQRLNLPCVYLAFDVPTEGLKEAVEGLKSLKALGFNLTMPHKEVVIPFLQELSPEAAIIGAVNTVKVEGNRLIGYNTDCKGFQLSLQDVGFAAKGKKVVIAGSGGAARSVALALAKEKVAQLVLLNRNINRAEEIALMLGEANPDIKVTVGALTQEVLAGELEEAELLVNSTPLGMEEGGRESIVEDASMLKPHLLVSDLLYYPPRTYLMQQAEAQGCKAMNGLSMLLWQAALAFEIWTGVPMPVEHVKEQFAAR